MQNIQHIREFYIALKLGKTPSSGRIVAVDKMEFHALFEAGQTTIKAFRSCRVTGKGNIQNDGFALSYAGAKLEILPPQKKKTAVTATSIESYHSLHLGEAVMKVAKAAIDLQAQNGYVTDRTLAEHIGTDPGTVSARRNDIKDAGGVDIDGVLYALEMGGRVRNVTGKIVQSWRLARQAQQQSLF